MSPRRLVAAGVLRRRRPCGSVLREPSSEQVYEGRLPLTRPMPVAPAVVGVNFLDVREARPTLSYEPTADAPVQKWVPWCRKCRLDPMAAYTQGGAEYLARMHDANEHDGVWTAEALPAAEVGRLAAGGVR